MNKLVYTIILMLAVATASIKAQDNRTLDTKVADLLAQMPANNLEMRDKAMTELIDMGPEGFQKLASMLTPPGEGDDTAVRFALNGLARYASAFGQCKARTFAEENLLKALEKQTDTEVKTYLLNQLNLVAGESAIAPVSKFLTDQDLCEPATQTLLAIGKKEAAKEFLGALEKASGQAKVTLLRALGELQCTGAVGQITPLITSEEKGMAQAALAALANTGSPESYDPLLKAAKAVGFGYESTNAAAAFLLYTKRLGEQNEIETMKKACKAVFKANTSADLLHNYTAALSFYTRYLGYEATPLLLKAMENENKAFRNAALALAVKTGGIADTRKWIEKAGSVSPEVKAEIISMLGQRGCDLATGLVTESLNDPSEEVRKAAITALRSLQQKEAVPVLLAHLTDGKDLPTTLLALNGLLDKDHLYPVAAELDNTSGKTKAALLYLIAAKAGTPYFDNVYASANAADPDEKAAALKGLKHVSTYENTDQLIKLLVQAKSENEIAAAQQALIAAVKGVEKERAAEGKVFAALKKASDKDRFIAILPEIGGDQALKITADYFTSSEGKTKAAAFEALTNWKEYAASKTLYEICKAGAGEYKQPAFISFTKMIRAANLPDDQKLLQYRKIMPYASSGDDKNFVIASIGNLKTFLSMVYLGQYLDKTELQQSASRAIMKIALPSNNQNNGFHGDIVRALLEKSKEVMSGDESQYYKIDIENYINTMPKSKGFVSMFNGKDLTGWKGLVENPIARAKMSEKELAAKQVEADKKMLENWSVKDGMIVFNGHGANLCSVKDYGDFEMIVDWLITKEGDSGIYLRGTPQVQIWDTSRVEVGAQVGSGGLYNNNKDNIRDPLKVADNPIDEWNTFRITMIGENVTVYLNGELVVDNVRMDNYWDRSIPIFETGAIELQAHGNELAFRDIYVREINTDEIGLTQEEIDEGFVSLFNGKNLDGWQGNKTDYYAANGELVVDPVKGGHGNLFTEKEYSDFIYRFEFQLTPGANNGLGIRAPLEGNAAYEGMELQILDNTAPIYAELQPYQYHGSVYGVIPAKRGYLAPVGEWNEEEVYIKGDKIKITLNGTVILEGDLAEASKDGTLDGNKHPGLKRKKGHIGYLGHGSKLKIRKIRIKDLSK